MSVPRILIRLAIFAAICVAAFLIYRALSRYSLDEIVEALRSIPPASVAMAVGFAAASYVCLTFFDYLALRYAGRPLAYRRAALTSFCALSIGHNIGVAALSSGAIRYRFYSRWGLSAEEVAKVVVFSGATVGLGLATLGAIGLLLYPADAERLMGLDRPAVVGVALSSSAIPIIYLALAARVRAPLKIRKWSFEMPPLKIAAPQIVIGTLNFACVAACLHQLLLAFGSQAYLKVAAIYVIGNVTALLSHVPGGLGVLEATVTYLLPGAASLAAMVAFRVVYFFVPIAIGLPTFLISEYVLRDLTPEEARQEAAE